MEIRAKLKTDKEPRVYSFTGHGDTDPERVKALWENLHPGGQFVEIVKPGLDRATGRILDHSKDEQSIAPEEAIVPSHEVNPGAVLPPTTQPIAGE